MRSLGRARMTNVAEKAGASIETVSLAVNRNPEMHKETRRRVRSVIEGLGYRSHVTVRSLDPRSTHTVALVVPKLASPTQAGRRGGMMANGSGSRLGPHSVRTAAAPEAAQVGRP